MVTSTPPIPATDAQALFAKANGMTTEQYLQFLADDEDAG